MHESCFSCDIRNKKSLLKADTEERFFFGKRQNKHSILSSCYAIYFVLGVQLCFRCFPIDGFSCKWCVAIGASGVQYGADGYSQRRRTIGGKSLG